MEYYSATKRRETLTLSTMCTNLEDMMLSREARHKRPVCDFIYVKCPEQANPQVDEVDLWVPRAEEDGGVTADGYGETSGISP